MAGSQQDLTAAFHLVNDERMDDLNDLQFFVQAVDHRGFAPAARAIGLPKSRLSRRIAELERVNQDLTERTGSSPPAEAVGKTLPPATDTAPPSPAESQMRLMEIIHSLATRVSELERRLGQDSTR